MDHAILPEDILNSTLPSDLKCWISNYFGGRQAFVEFRGQKSSHRRIRMGVPQDRVLPPILFNIYLAALPEPLPNISLISYADDCTVFFGA